MKEFIFSWGFVFIAALMDSFAGLMVKSRFNQVGHMDFSSISEIVKYMLIFLKSPVLLAGVISFVLAPGFWFIALNRIEISIGYPVLVALHFIFITTFALLFLKESVTLPKLIGIILILISLVLFQIKSK